MELQAEHLTRHSNAMDDRGGFEAAYRSRNICRVVDSSITARHVPGTCPAHHPCIASLKSPPARLAMPGSCTTQARSMAGYPQIMLGHFQPLSSCAGGLSLVPGSFPGLLQTRPGRCPRSQTIGTGARARQPAPTAPPECSASIPRCCQHHEFRFVPWCPLLLLC